MLQLTRSQKIQATKAAKIAARRPSIAHMVFVEQHGNSIVTRLSVGIDGIAVVGELDNVNKMLERLGYKPVRITYNMLNKEAGPIVIDADTPSCCDVSSESYWSM